MDDKPMYIISVVSEMLGMHPQTIRQYEKSGLIKPSRTDGNTRMYSEVDIKRLECILLLTKEMKVNIAGVDIILRMSDEIKKLRESIEEIESKIENNKDTEHIVSINIKSNIRGEK